MFALDDALKFLDQARESAEALHRDSDVAAIDEEIGDTQESRGTTQTAVASYERALTRATAPEARAALRAKIGYAYGQVGDVRGLAFLETALAELDPSTQTNELALSTAFVGRYYHYRSELRKAIEFYERARQLAEPLDKASTLGTIYSFLAGSHQHLLLYEESDHWAREGIALGERKQDPHAIAVGNEFLAENATGRGFWDDALAYAELDRVFGAKCGSLARAAWADFPTVLALHGKGELAAARDAALAALELCARIGEGRLATWFEPMLAAIAADLGDVESARGHAEHGWARAQELSQVVLSGWSLHAAATPRCSAATLPTR